MDIEAYPGAVVHGLGLVLEAAIVLTAAEEEDDRAMTVLGETPSN